MQDTPGSSFVYQKPKTMSHITVKLKGKTTLALDGVRSEEYEKGKVLTSQSTLQEKILSHLVDAGKADLVGDEKSEPKGKKVKKPKETKSKKTKSKK